MNRTAYARGKGLDDLMAVYVNDDDSRPFKEIFDECRQVMTTHYKTKVTSPVLMVIPGRVLD